MNSGHDVLDAFFLTGLLCCSGERTSAKDWPGILEIKGRVRLDAFEKFLQELPLSRSRAVMVSLVYFCCTENLIYLKSTPGDKKEQKQKMKEQRIFKLFFSVFHSNLLATMLGIIIGYLLLRQMFWATIPHLDCKEKCNFIRFISNFDWFSFSCASIMICFFSDNLS